MKFQFAIVAGLNELINDNDNKINATGIILIFMSRVDVYVNGYFDK